MDAANLALAEPTSITTLRPVRPARAWPRKTLWAAGVAALLAIGGLVVADAWRFPAGPDAGAAFLGAVSHEHAATSSASPARFRIGTFNIHAGRGTDGARDLTRTAAALRDMDLVALNEVQGPSLWQSGDQSQALGETLGMSWLFAPSESRWLHGSYGNGMLSRLPVIAWQRIPFARDGAKSYRNLVLTVVGCAGRRVNVVATHLDSRDPQRRQAQLRVAGELFLSLAPPAVLLGDMNTRSDDPVLARLLTEPGVRDCLAEGLPSDVPRRIDWILARGAHSTAAGMVDEGASDHPLFWADLELDE